MASGRRRCRRSTPARGATQALTGDTLRPTLLQAHAGTATMNMPPTRIELLQRMPVFGAIREDVLQDLLASARERVVRGGDYFFRENDPADSMFVLESGRASVIKTWQGRDYVLHQLGAGDCLGEMALMDLFPRSASIRADEDCHAIEIGMAELLRLFERDAEQFALIQMNIGREVCRRLRATDELLFRFSMGDTSMGAQTPFGTT
jgi:CRP/FNR family transcriptional regulator, cyclic AMP receptor protein